MSITALLVLKCNPKNPNPIILASAFDFSGFNYFYRPNMIKFVRFFASAVAYQTPPSKRQTVIHEEYIVHAYNRNGLCAVGITDDHYPVRSAFSLLNQVLDEYQKNFGETWSSGKEVSKHKWPYIVEALETSQDPAEADRLMNVQRELDETNIIFHKSIDSLLGRGEKLDSLVRKISGLNVASKMFFKQARNTPSCSCTIL